MISVCDDGCRDLTSSMLMEQESVVAIVISLGSDNHEWMEKTGTHATLIRKCRLYTDVMWRCREIAIN